MSKTREKIKEYLLPYLENRFIMNQDIMEETSEPKIPFSIWIQNVEAQEEAIADMMQKHTLEKVSASDVKKAKEKYSNFLLKYGNRILLSEGEIEEILSYVEEAIDTFQENDLSGFSSENAFVRKILTKFVKQNPKDKTAKRYQTYFETNQSMGFDKRIEGLIGIDQELALSIYNHHKMPIVILTKEGEVKEACKLENENILLAKNLYVGDLHIGEKVKRTVFLKVKVNGTEKYRAIDYNYEDYQEEGFPFVKIVDRLNDFLRQHDYVLPLQPIYNATDFNRVLDYFLFLVENAEKQDKESTFEKLMKRLFG